MNTITVTTKNNKSHFHPTWRWLREGDNFMEALAIVFETLPYSYLCTCAIVSKTWRKLVVNELQSRCTVTVKNIDEIRFVLQKLKTCASFRVEKCFIKLSNMDTLLLREMLHGMQNTVSVLKLEILYTTQRTYIFQILKNLPHLVQFSVTFISSDKNKGFNERGIPNQHCHPDFVFLSMDYVPEQGNCAQSQSSGGSSDSDSSSDRNIDNEAFIHRGIRHLHFDIGKNARFQLSKVFRAFPNVVELNISNIVDEPLKLFKRRQGQSNECRNLKYLSLRQYSNIGFNEKLIQTLLKLDLSLESLMLIMHPPTRLEHKFLQTSGLLLKQFIETQRASLKSLKLIQVEDDVYNYNDLGLSKNNTKNFNKQNFSVCADLAKETLDMCSCWNFNYSSPSILLFPVNLSSLEVLHVQKPLITNLAQVLKHFPRLRHLSIQVSPNGSNWKGMLPQNLESHMGITAFKLDFIDPDSFSRLVHFFPSLQTLQLAYCDKSLFNVICKLIPCFNAAVAKKSFTSCTECHGKDEQTLDLKSKKEMVRWIPCSLMQDQSGHRNVESHSNNFQMKQVCQGSTNPITFQHLKLLRVRPCRHLPYENIVFLKNGSGNEGQTFQNFANLKAVKFGGASDGEFDSSFGFSWYTAGVMKETEFVDLPLHCPDSTESCSSA